MSELNEFPVIGKMNKWQIFKSQVSGWYIRNISRKLPRLVWYGEELDVVVTFSEDPLSQNDSLNNLQSGGLYEIQEHLRHMGIEFDSGQGPNGRDWEWDWSLSGPISVRFRNKATKPEKRLPVKPKLTVVH